MSRRYNPNGRRRKPGRPPPYRYQPKPQPGGYTGNGLNLYWSSLMPGLQGKQKKEFFNNASIGMSIGLACGGAIIGYNSAGILAAIVGAGMGLIGGCRITARGRFYRA